MMRPVSIKIDHFIHQPLSFPTDERMMDIGCFMHYAVYVLVTTIKQRTCNEMGMVNDQVGVQYSIGSSVGNLVRRLKNCTGYSCISNLQVLAYKASFVTMY
jgi:hypothetical protein